MDEDLQAQTPQAPQADEAEPFARRLRLELAREHLGCADGDETMGLGRMYAAFAACAEALDDWHARGQVGPRPPGQLRTYRMPRLSRRTQAWADPLYRLFYDPDGRPRNLRKAKAF